MPFSSGERQEDMEYSWREGNMINSRHTSQYIRGGYICQELNEFPSG
jgi:hypothetical protein